MPPTPLAPQVQTELVEVYPSKEYKLMLQAAAKQQKARNDAYLGLDVLLGALLDDREVGAAVTDAGLTKAQLQSAIGAVRSSDTHIDSATGDENFQALNKYGTDLTANAARLDPVIGARAPAPPPASASACQWQRLPVPPATASCMPPPSNLPTPSLPPQNAGRDEEVRRVIRVLCRRTKNNPVLVGEPGVGKTAIVEGLAQRLVKVGCCCGALLA
jgi:ATP-dependent Clp protease ATP-binding subunit ClpB